MINYQTVFLCYGYLHIPLWKNILLLESYPECHLWVCLCYEIKVIFNLLMNNFRIYSLFNSSVFELMYVMYVHANYIELKWYCSVVPHFRIEEWNPLTSYPWILYSNEYDFLQIDFYSCWMKYSWIDLVYYQSVVHGQLEQNRIINNKLYQNKNWCF